MNDGVEPEEGEGSEERLRVEARASAFFHLRQLGEQLVVDDDEPSATGAVHSVDVLVGARFRVALLRGCVERAHRVSLRARGDRGTRNAHATGNIWIRLMVLLVRNYRLCYEAYAYFQKTARQKLSDYFFR